MADWSKDTFAKNLRYYASRRGISQKELAEIIGVSAPTMNEWFKGKKFPRMDKVELLANYFNILKSDLIEDKTHAPGDFELSERKKELVKKVMELTDEQLDRFEQILSLVETM